MGGAGSGKTNTLLNLIKHDDDDDDDDDLTDKIYLYIKESK